MRSMVEGAHAQEPSVPGAAMPSIKTRASPPLEGESLPSGSDPRVAGPQGLTEGDAPRSDRLGPHPGSRLRCDSPSPRGGRPAYMHAPSVPGTGAAVFKTFKEPFEAPADAGSSG